MTIEKLYYINDRGDTLEFSSNSLYHVNISKITGLSDVKNILYTTSSMGQDGDTITGNKIPARIITIDGAIKSLNKDVIMTSRQLLNKVLNPHLMGTLVYEYGNLRRYIKCRLESAPVFTRNSALLMFDIDVVCYYPFWQDESETKTNIAGWVGKFEFNLNNDGLEIPSTGIELGLRTTEVVVVVDNDGDVKTGLRVEFVALGTVTNPRLTNIITSEYLGFQNLTLLEGDRLVITTEYGEKACVIYRGEETINALPYWDPAGKFLSLDIGSNYFAFFAQTNPDRLDVSIYKTNKYLGV